MAVIESVTPGQYGPERSDFIHIGLHLTELSRRLVTIIYLPDGHWQQAVKRLSYFCGAVSLRPWHAVNEPAAFTDRRLLVQIGDFERDGHVYSDVKHFFPLPSDPRPDA